MRIILWCALSNLKSSKINQKLCVHCTWDFRVQTFIDMVKIDEGMRKLVVAKIQGGEAKEMWKRSLEYVGAVFEKYGRSF